MFAIDLNGDTLLDYTYRSDTHLYAYDHYGSLLWKTPIPYPGININLYGAKHGAADLDGDGQIEIAALNDSDQVLVFNGSDGSLEATIDVAVDTLQKAGCLSVANFRGEGDRDLVIQTMDVSTEYDSSRQYYYIHRSLVAVRMDTRMELWRVNQDRNLRNGIYEGYWGPAHGTFQCADVDGDGKDEIVGGNMIDDDGQKINLAYPTGWVGYDTSIAHSQLVDHLDAVSVGDYRPDLPGLEWAVCEEDWVDGPSEFYSMNTTLMSKDGILWRQLTTGLFYALNEPQEVAGGNFSTDHPHGEIWNSSRLPRIDRGYDSQRPWVYNYGGNQIASYYTKDTMTSGFNSHENGNGQGVEPSCTIDWAGGKKEHLAVKARHVNGNIGVMDAMTGALVWSTTNSVPAVQASSFYVADVSGDGREEIIIHDWTDGKIKIYWNANTNPNQPKPDKWDDPLYRRIKQNYNTYAPGGYTYGDYPLVTNVQIHSVTTTSAVVTWNTDVPSDSRVRYGTTSEYGQATALNTDMVISHSVNMTGLPPNTLHHFQVESGNAYHKIGLCKDSTFQTLAVYVKIKLFLEGAYQAAGDSMTTALNGSGYIPETSPYSEDPRTVPAIPAGVVDWILVQLRTRADSAAVNSRSAFLRKDGMVVAEDGVDTNLDMSAVEGSYYLVVKHRNHLAVMSSVKMPVNSE